MTKCGGRAIASGDERHAMSCALSSFAPSRETLLRPDPRARLPWLQTSLVALLIELKSVEQLAAVHAKQVLTYLRLMNLPLGLLINFGASTFKEGVKRVVNHHLDTASSRLRINRGPE
ncbi:MAG: GxxExxY protein [Lamprocystis purpurea]|nr:GxxExxY protein [Lamprocystis purpurea]